MVTIQLPPDFKDFLKLLHEKQVEYLLVGGYAVSYHGYSRATADMDIWIAIHQHNAEKIVKVIREFGFAAESLSTKLFLKENKIIRMGLPPLRIEVLTTISGVSFEECYSERIIDKIDKVEINLISLKHLKINKKAAGKLKDLADLEYLP